MERGRGWDKAEAEDVIETGFGEGQRWGQGGRGLG